VDEDHGRIHFRSHRTSAGQPLELDVTYEPSGPPFQPIAGTLEYFLMERYCLYTSDGTATVERVNIHHPLWQLQQAEAVFRRNSMIEPFRVRLSPAAPVLHFARRQDAVAWLPEVV
jgi:uncharacterized protein